MERRADDAKYGKRRRLKKRGKGEELLKNVSQMEVRKYSKNEEEPQPLGGRDGFGRSVAVALCL